MIKNAVAFSNNDDISKAFDEVREQINQLGTPKLIVFSAPVEGFDFFTKKFYANYRDAITMGVSTYIAYCNKGATESGLAALAIYDGIECYAGVLHEISTFPLKYSANIENAVKKLSDVQNTVCIEFSTAFGMCEELVQDTFRSVLEHRKIQVIGGTAGALASEKETYVALNGEFYDESSVFVLIKNLSGRIITYKENMYKTTGHFMTATDVDCDERLVYSYDDRPAAEVMAMLLDVPIENVKSELMQRPVGRITGKEVYITNMRDVYPDGSISYSARIYNRTKLSLLEVDDIERVWNETAANISYEIPSPSLSFVVNCFGRTNYFRRNGMFEDFVNKLSCEYGNFIGMTGFGEQINYEHFNQTMVMAVFE